MILFVLQTFACVCDAARTYGSDSGGMKFTMQIGVGGGPTERPAGAVNALLTGEEA